MLKLSPILAVWISCFCTATNVVISKIATPYVTSALFLFWACFFMCAVAFFIIGKQGWKRIVSKDVLWKGLGMGTFGTALPMTVFMVALNYTTPVNSAIDNQFEIIYSLVLSYIVLKERPTLQQILGSVLVLVGVVLIVLNIYIPFIALAETHEGIYLPGAAESIKLPMGDPALNLLMEIRDEVHRFAITYHRKLRNKGELHGHEKQEGLIDGYDMG